MFGMRLLLKQSLDLFVAMLLHLSENICVWRRPAKVSVVSQPAGGPPPSGWVGSFFEHLFNCAVVTGLRLSAHIPNHNAAGSHSVAFFVLIYSRFRQNNRGKTLQTRRFTRLLKKTKAESRPLPPLTGDHHLINHQHSKICVFLHDSENTSMCNENVKYV